MKGARLFFLVALVSCCLAEDTVVTLTTSSGTTLTIKVEIADTAAERSRGLMNRQSLPDGEGMLFVFEEETLSSFWMKDTPISLDILFVKEGRIVDIIENTVPNSEALLTPDTSYLQALEVPGGYSSRNGIQVGDLIDPP